ncbi:MAG: dTDP-4-dehydrorhamnose 3,5-epimerase [Spirochaetia bacterium]
MMEIEKTELEGVLLVRTGGFEDFRGEYVETYNEEEYLRKGVACHFVQDDISVSTRNVLRGIHGDAETWKLISCLHGKFYLVVVNCDRDSAHFGKWRGFTLSDKNRLQVLVPPMHGNGHLVLSETAIFHYKQTSYYNPKGQFTYKWNDPQFKIWWPASSPLVSRRDEEGHFV